MIMVLGQFHRGQSGNLRIFGILLGIGFEQFSQTLGRSVLIQLIKVIYDLGNNHALLVFQMP